MVKAMHEITDIEQKKAFAREKVLPERIRVCSLWNKAFMYQLMSTNTKGAMGSLADLELIALRRSPEHNIGSPKTPFDEELKALLGGSLPEDAVLSDKYQGPPRIIVPTIRTTLEANEDFSLQVIVLNNTNSVADVNLYRRELGAKHFTKTKVNHVARGVYTIHLPKLKSDFEYYIESNTPGNEILRWPATAPALNQTVIYLPE